MTLCLAGLGNPGPEYSRSRHNAGRLFLEFLIQTWKAIGAGKKSECDLRRVERHGKEILLASPRSYMNLSGPPIASLIGSCGISPDQLLVLHDDIDLPLGRLQLKRGGGAAGHRGVESLYQSLGSSDFYRLRIGVGRPTASTRDYVLSEFDPVELKVLDELFAHSTEGIDHWIRGDTPAAAKELNTAIP